MAVKQDLMLERYSCEVIVQSVGTNIYLQLTDQFNVGRLRTILSSGQAVVLHRLAVMSKDGDWILREDEEAIDYVLGVLAQCNAVYRFGAPLDRRWLSGGWSTHLEFKLDDLRVRTDFVTRPPRIAAADLARMWQEQQARQFPFVDVRELIDLKKTNREKDYAVIGELARLLSDPAQQMLQSRSALDLIELADRHPDLVPRLVSQRPALRAIADGRDRLDEALDVEKRFLIRANEQRLRAYLLAAEAWSSHWRTVQHRIADLPLQEAHQIVVAEAHGILPFTIGNDTP